MGHAAGDVQLCFGFHFLVIPAFARIRLVCPGEAGEEPIRAVDLD